MTSIATPLSIYQLRIVLRGISPLIWRRVLVPSSITLAHLHTILQILFVWSDEHLHSFHIHGREYGSSGANTHQVRLRACFENHAVLLAKRRTMSRIIASFIRLSLVWPFRS
jgi:hypothetical protein